ncbi:MAG: sodium:calcium antiporter [Clostridia bacterium]|nr:sodium:calcium antiporter [Clostridia bacterium]
MFEALSVVLFVLSFVLILKGGEMLVESAIFISHKAKIPPMIVGATVVSLATTMPETSVSTLAVLRGDMALASGNALGSMICNFALILGIAFTILPSSVDRKGFRSKCFFLIIDYILLIVFAFSGKFSIVEGIILLCVLVLFLVGNIIEARKHPESFVEIDVDKQKTWVMILEFVVGALAITFGSHVSVVNSTSIGKLLHINQKIVALTIVAIGTGLPEVVTTITSIKQNNAGIGVGNMIGANILNGTLLMGVCSILSKGKLMVGSGALLTFLTLLFCYVVAIIPTLIRGKSSRVQGIMLLSIYVVYVVCLFFV